MIKTIGIVRETKNVWERRVPLIPTDVRALLTDMNIRILVQPSSNRIFEDPLYEEAGAILNHNLNECDLIVGIKEIKLQDLLDNKFYMFFSHTIKGQSYNMPMLQKLMDLKCTLLDYERIINEKGMRLIYFSFHAGVAGIVDTMWTYARYLKWKGINSPFNYLKQTISYDGLYEAEQVFQDIGEEIKKEGLPQTLSPFVIGITGYGNVARGVQHLLDLLPYKEIHPTELISFFRNKNYDSHTIYKVIFEEKDMVIPVSDNTDFDLTHYYQNPEEYKTQFEQYLPYLTILVNASYWDTSYPRHVTRQFIKRLYQSGQRPLLSVIGDISCDIEGGIEITLKATDPGNPYFTYDVGADKAINGFSETGPVIMSVDNLPSELPRDASVYFSSVLKTLLPEIVTVDFSVPFDQLNLPDHLKKAIILFQGRLTPEYEYLNEYLMQ
jgi:saccharopine dehydrogenase (NAD+, L-lysine-forming)